MKTTKFKTVQSLNLFTRIQNLSDDDFLFEAQAVIADGMLPEDETEALRDILKRGEQAEHDRGF